MKMHGIKSVTIEGVDVYIEDCDIDLEIERDSICISKDIEGSANVSITKGVLDSGCSYGDLATIAQWCIELLDQQTGALKMDDPIAFAKLCEKYAAINRAREDG